MKKNTGGDAMEVYKEIRSDIFAFVITLVVIKYIFQIFFGIFDIGIDDTDKDGFNRSGVELITDYGTGMQYLYKDGVLVPRLDAGGNHIRISK